LRALLSFHMCCHHVTGKPLETVLLALISSSSPTTMPVRAVQGSPLSSQMHGGA
jgi:hypothetical protein